jgi:hypothetical protein
VSTVSSLVDTVIAFQHARAADQADWQVEATHATPAGNLISDAESRDAARSWKRRPSSPEQPATAVTTPPGKSVGERQPAVGA